MREKILLLMSGGVDSSVSALLLMETYEVTGVTMKIPGSSAHEGAKKVAAQLGIPHITVDTEKIFTESVIDKFIRSRNAGITPNPCADCNKALKFGAVPKLAEEMLGISGLRIASGHYASITGDTGHKHICRAADREKDQSYFLCDVPYDVIQRLIFPLGGMTKREVRDIARSANMEAAVEPESMDTCFSIPGIDPGKTVNGKERGVIIGMDGKIIGEHNGISNYTLGQRKGLGIAAKEPLYVLSIDAAKNLITAGTQSEVFKNNVRAVNINYLTDKTQELIMNLKLFGKTRSRGEPSPCKITGVSRESFSVEFESPQFAPTPGQRLVCYDENSAMMLSGVIV